MGWQACASARDAKRPRYLLLTARNTVDGFLRVGSLTDNAATVSASIQPAPLQIKGCGTHLLPSAISSQPQAIVESKAARQDSPTKE